MLLIDTARDNSMNVLIESSGRDITMFDYMNYCFPSDRYHRLVVHFTIDDIRFAENSVDRRMMAEMEAGRRSILDVGENDDDSDDDDSDNDSHDDDDDSGSDNYSHDDYVDSDNSDVDDDHDDDNYDYNTSGGGGGGVVAQIAANAGGPYGSSQLRSVQSDSDKVASIVFNDDSTVASGWFKASISITACDQGPWTIRANSEGSQVFSFP
jgi:hypothetical protein